MTRMTLTALTLTAALALPSLSAAAGLGDYGYGPDTGMSSNDSQMGAGMSDEDTQMSDGNSMGQVDDSMSDGGPNYAQSDPQDRLIGNGSNPSTQPGGPLPANSANDTPGQAIQRANLNQLAAACGEMGGAELRVRGTTHRCRSASGQTLAMWR